MDARTLSEIDMRVSEATPGPWKINRNAPEQEVWIDAPKGDPRLDYAKWENMITVYGCEDDPTAGNIVADRNATFIAHAREDVALLLSEVHRLQREIEAMSREDDKRIRTARDAGAEAMRWAAVRSLQASYGNSAAQLVVNLKVFAP